MRESVGVKWFDLGLELLDDDDFKELNIIRAEHPSDYNKCCTKMFQFWLNTQPTASWNQLIKALRQESTDLDTLANKIEQMLLKPKGQLFIISLIMSH